MKNQLKERFEAILKETVFGLYPKLASQLQQRHVDKIVDALYQSYLMGLCGRVEKQDVENLADDLYNNIPVGEVHAFDLIKLIKSHYNASMELVETPVNIGNEAFTLPNPPQS